MMPQRLLKHFDRISDVPDAIPRLRRFILDLAVRGKLVEQDPRDEPVVELLKRINTGKERGLPQVEFAKPRFEIPARWCWVSLSEIAEIVMGQSPPGQTYNKTGEGIPLINGPVEFTEGPFGKTVVNQYTTAPTNLCEEGDLLLCVRGSTTGRTNIAGFRACIGRGVAAIRPLISGSFIHLVIWRLRELIIALGRGIAFPSVNRQQIEELAVPLPPLPEQHRIVAKVDELMALCDRLETAQAERGSRRDRLVASSLNRLNNGADADAFCDHARFYFNHLPRLTTKREHIQQLRQTILNLAVRGKLVSQDLNDEPAYELLEKVAVQKGKAGGARTGRDWVGDLTKPVDQAFYIPKGWAWTRIANAVERVTVGYVGPMKQHYVEDGIPFLRSQNVRANRFREDGLINVSQKFHQTISKSALAPGDVVVVRSGNVGTACVIPPSLLEANCSDLVVVKRPTGVHPNYLCFYLNSLAATHIQAGTVGVALTHFNTKSVATMPLPLPPIAEQQRIVAKVDELMALCDKLEAQLTTAHNESRRFLEAVLYEALVPAV